MELLKEDLPATLQAFDLQSGKEIFIAEQVVNSQPEAEAFTSRYTGKLIKAKKAHVPETRPYADTGYRKPPSSTGIVMVIIVLILIALVIYGFSTGWIQQKFNLKV